MTKKIVFSFLLLFGLLSCKDKVVVEFAEQEEGSEMGASGTPKFCQCVAYIKNKLGITRSTANAKDWGVGRKYIPDGYYEVSTPQRKDIIVLQPSFGQGVHTTYGHIAFVYNTYDNGNGTYNVEVAGTNQGNRFPFPAECGCNNTSYLTYTVNNNNKGAINYYRHSAPPFVCGW